MELNNRPVFFPSQKDFRSWLEENYQNSAEVLVGYYKLKTGKPSMTWSESVDQAICFGWIDGIRRSIDEESYCIRFTPRRPTSIWSAVNIKKVEELTKKGLMLPAGLAAFNLKKDEKSAIYSYENSELALTDDFEKHFKANEKAWNFFQTLSASVRKISIRWVMSAKQEITRQKRLNELINDSESGRKIKGLNY